LHSPIFTIMIDYRSDTVTKPGKAMLEAISGAKVGDDVFGEDPSVNELQEYAASLFGMESALFCPSGTMTNQLAIKCHTQPGDEVICDQSSHIYNYEGGGIAFNSGCQVRLLCGERGLVNGQQVESAINNDDIHKPFTRLVSVENTSNRGGGSCYELETLTAIRKICDKHQLAFHLDGARLFNALVEKNQSPKEYGTLFDTISICLSKGLGAPVGSLLLGSKEIMKKALRFRKVFGGGMRQAGYMATAGLYALKNNIQLLHADHLRAKEIAEALLKKDFTGKMLPVETNIIIFEVTGGFSPHSLTQHFREHGILIIPFSENQVRMVLHLDITTEMVEKTLETIHHM